MTNNYIAKEMIRLCILTLKISYKQDKRFIVSQDFRNIYSNVELPTRIKRFFKYQTKLPVLETLTE